MIRKMQKLVKPAPVLLMVGTLIIFLFFGRVVFHANQYLLIKNGDGVKNYYTLAWYLKHDHGTRFTGMNYPYGEHINYTDGQPLLAWLLKSTAPVTGDLSGYTLGIVNLLILFSFIPAAWLLFLILRYYRVPGWPAVAMALCIAFLTPQMARLAGHYSLVHAWIIPLFWWLMIRWRKAKRKLPACVWLGLVLLGAGFLHAYFLVMGAAFLTAWALLLLFLNPEKENRFRPLGLLATAFFSLLAFQLFTHLTDPFTGRAQVPYGFFVYRTFFSGIVSRPGSQLTAVLGPASPNIENYAYAGLVPLLALVFGALYWFANRWPGKRQPEGQPLLPRELNLFLGAAALVLLLAFGLPFTWFPGLLDQVPFVRQFRSIGRLAWIFYYVAGIWAAVGVWSMYARLKNNGLKTTATIFLLGILGVWASESWLNLRIAHSRLPMETTRFYAKDYSPLLQEAGYRAADFQAILPLPYYNLGSEKLYIIHSQEAVTESMKASFELGLPLATIYLARSPVSTSFRLAQLLSGPMIEKTLLKDLPDNRPFLVLACGKALEQPEEDLLNHSTFLAGAGNIALYALYPDSLPDSTIREWNRYNLLRDSVKITGEAFPVPAGSVYYKSFNHSGYSEFSMAGNGALYEKEGTVTLLDSTFYDIGQEYELSFWMFSHPLRAAFPWVKVSHYRADGTLTEENYIDPKQTLEIYGQWVRIRMRFTPEEAGERWKVISYGKRIVIDELLLHPQETRVYTYATDSSAWVNNYPLHRPN